MSFIEQVSDNRDNLKDILNLCTINKDIVIFPVHPKFKQWTNALSVDFELFNQ